MDEDQIYYAKSLPQHQIKCIQRVPVFLKRNKKIQYSAG